MSLELNLGQTSDIIVDELYNDIKDFEKMLLQNFGYHYGDVGIFTPLYSWDYAEEAKHLKKMLKSFIKVYNYYSEVEYESDD